MVKRRTPKVKTTETSARTAAVTTDKETVRYASGTVQLGPKVAYEEVGYLEEDIYEYPN